MEQVSSQSHNIISCQGNDKVNFGTPIQNFYAGQSIFITGGTGFFGKVLIEKLLRSCPDISKIYVLIRLKKNKNIEDRLDEMFNNSLFDLLREKSPNFYNKIVPLVGNICEEGLEFSDDDMNMLLNEVSIVFHLAASVRFTENIKISLLSNLVATNSIINIVKRMPNLKSFIHVSSLYTNSLFYNLEELIYEYPICPKEMVRKARTLSNSELEESLANMITLWPNTYAFTKTLAETLIAKKCGNLQVGIFRPPLVTSIANEPVVGWIDNHSGSTGLVVLLFQGLIKVLWLNKNVNAHIVPVDITINALIASAWDVYNQSERRGDRILIYNQILKDDASLTFGEYFNYILQAINIYPLSKCYWLPTAIIIENRILFNICAWFAHTLPVLLIRIVNKKDSKFQKRMSILYKMVYSLYNSTIFYTTNNKFTYTDDNLHAMWDRLNKEDQRLYNFNLKGFDWSQYINNYVKGIRIYLMKDDMSTLKVARIRWKRFYWINQTTKFFLLCIFFWCMWKLFVIIIG